MNHTKKLTKAFFESKNIEDGESEKIELDNLDEARLVLKEGSTTEIEVENEYGTRFPVSDLSNEEVKVFLFVLK